MSENTQGLTFTEAMQAVFEGKSVARSSMRGSLRRSSDGQHASIRYVDANGSWTGYSQSAFDREDFEATDWEIRP